MISPETLARIAAHDSLNFASDIVGGAITAGWFSSIAAAACLLGCTIVFFTKFATFIVVTLTASFIHAVVVLPVVLAALGPAYVQPPPR